MTEEKKTYDPLPPRELTRWLKYNFPELGNDEPMDGGDTVEALCSLYHYARIGHVEELLDVTRKRRDALREAQRELNLFLEFDYQGPLTELLNTSAEELVGQANVARVAREEADEAREVRDTT